MPTTNIHGYPLYYEVEGTGPPVVFISGLTGDHFAWAIQVPAFTAAGYRCLVYDNRDTGQSQSGPATPYTIRQLADDAVALMEHAGVTPAHIVGASMGGMIAQEIAINHPGHVSSLTLVCSVATMNAVAAPRVWKALRPHCPAEDFVQIAVSPWLFTHRFYERPEPMAGFLELVRNNPFPQSVESFERQCDAVMTHDAHDRLGRISAPTHVVVGTEDILTPRRYSQTLAERIPGAKLTEIPAAGHGLFWERPAEFNQAVLDFLEAQRRAAPAGV